MGLFYTRLIGLRIWMPQDYGPVQVQPRTYHRKRVELLEAIDFFSVSLLSV